MRVSPDHAPPPASRCRHRARLAFRFLPALLVLAFARTVLAAAGPPHGLGCRLPSAQEQAAADQNAIVVDKVYLNKFGLDRLNKERAAKGLKQIDEKAVDLGDNDLFISGKTRKGNKAISAQVRKALVTGATPIASLATQSAQNAAAQSANVQASLPSSVDNSTTIWFPPVGNQQQLNTCASYSSAYYTMTYLVARANNWNVTAGPANEIFSPKFIYNMINNGGDNGSWVQTAYQVMSDHGAPFLSVWPYDTNTTALPTTAPLWRGAIPYRMGVQGTITGLDTAAGLQNLKTMLANGYIVNACMDIDNWHFTTIKYDPAPGADNSVVGWPVCDYAAGAFYTSGHCMTIVGYDDNVWVDINNNGVVDPGEMGAFKVVNQWGTSGFGRNGYAYLSYDSIRATSAVSGTGTYDSSSREQASNGTSTGSSLWFADAYWIQPRPAGYQPTLLAQCTLNTAQRAAATITLGYGLTTGSAPTETWTPTGFLDSGYLNMAGGTTAADGTCVFDLTDIAAGGTLLDWYLQVLDDTAGSSGIYSCTVKSFTLTDGSGNQLATTVGTSPAGGLPQTASLDTIQAWTQYKVTDASVPATVTNLAVAATGSGAASLTWTQPGNNGMNGVAYSYDLVYSTSPITSANFSSATPFISGTAGYVPGVPGSTGSATVTGLTPGLTYYFALETSDYEGNWSGISNVPSATLPTALTITSSSPLPAAVVGLPYSTQLQASGGVTPYSWSAPTFYYAENTSGTAALATGTGIGAIGSPGGAYYAFTSGFTFPITGGSCTYAEVSSNGYMYVYSANSYYEIYPFCTSLNTTGTGENVYVTNDASHVVFRWQAHQNGAAGSVNFQAVLYKNGSIEFDYGAISGVTSAPLIAIQPAVGAETFSLRNGLATIPSGSSSYFTYYASPLPGLTLDPSTGILSGTPVLTSTYSVPITVADSSTLQQTCTGNFTLAVGGTGSVLEIVPGSIAVQTPMGGSVNVPVHLSQAPASPVTVTTTFSSGDTDITITGGSSLTFTSSNWNLPQQLTLAAPANVVNGEAIITLSAPGMGSVPLIVTESDPGPTLVSGPTASPSTVTGTQAIVSATGADNNGASALTYTWSTIGTPPAAVTFPLNGSNAGQSTPAIFTRAGTYNLRVTIADASGNTVSGSTSVTVAQTPSSVTVTPASSTIQTLATQQFTATSIDQFGYSISPAPTFAWAVAGGGAISGSGLFTSGSSAGGPYAVTASASGLTGTASVSLVKSPPTIAILSPSTGSLTLSNLSNSLVLSASASDPFVTPTVTWSQTSGPVGHSAVFANANLANTSVTFSGSGSYTLTATASDGALTSSQSLTIGAGVAVQSLTDADIGPVGAAGSGVMSGGTFTVIGSGADITGTSDAFNYYYSQISGNFTITARVVSVNLSGNSKAGVMIRQSADPAAQEVLTAMTGGNGVTFQYRTAYGGNTGAPKVAGLTAPYWVRLVRSGTAYSSFYSPDGASWTQLPSTQNITMTDPVLVGLAVTSHNKGVLCTGTFDNVSGLPIAVAAPQVSPGAAPSATAGVAVALSGSASAPAGATLSTLWSQTSGSGTALFGNAASPATTVTLSATGSYVLTLTGSDSAATVFQNLAISASAPATPPTITSIAGKTIAANSAAGPIPFTVTDAQVGAGSLLITASSSNPTLLPGGNIVLTNTNGACTVTATPAANQTGTATVTISVFDGTFTTSTAFTLTVTQTFASWASAYPALGSLSGPLNDPSGQGIPNILSYAYGLNPMAQNASALPVVGQQNGCMTITYRQSKSAPDLTFTVEATGNLSTGTWSASGITEIARQDMGTYWLVTDCDAVPISGTGSATSQFMHLKVSMP